LYASVAVGIAEECGFFGQHITDPKWDSLSLRATEDDLKRVQEWSTIIKNAKKISPTMSDFVARGEKTLSSSAEVFPMQNTPQPLSTLALTLNEDQCRAFDIVRNHLVARLNGLRPPQLLMTIIGQGGVGKSKLINALSEAFEFHGARDQLAKTALTGIAATVIHGTTLHWWGGLPIKNCLAENWLERAGKAILDRRKNNILDKEYLIIDEASMLTTDLMNMVSNVTGHIRTCNGVGNTSMPFGGMNVIIVADFHQFPPVGKKASTLYHDENQRVTAKLGRAIFLQFETVVILRQQMRISDHHWIEILGRLREGECTEQDLKDIRQLVLTNKKCDIPDFSKEPWSEAILITARHSVRNAWNAMALNNHCNKTGHIRYISSAEDSKGRNREDLSIHERYEVARLTADKTGRLPDRVEIAIGMKTLVTWNLATDADLANGTRGTITQIILDPREEGGIQDGVKLLQFPPAMILFKPNEDSQQTFPNVEKGYIPIFPSEATFTIHPSPKKTKSITRRQLAVDSAYSFTDYRSQGQTLEYVIIDIGHPPKGPLSPFNAYVALSRSRGRQNIRLLRDFDDSLFTHHPCEALRDEDERLQRMNDKTKTQFSQGAYSYKPK
jgi:ATP-dependent exoDNAse (exonuclease V), alpha subunit - helicase superfamily I member